MNLALNPAPTNRSAKETIVNTGQNWLVSSLIWVSHTRLMKSMPYSNKPPGLTPPDPSANAPNPTFSGRHTMPPPMSVRDMVSTLAAYSATTMNRSVSSWPTTSESSSLALRLRALCRW